MGWTPELQWNSPRRKEGATFLVLMFPASVCNTGNKAAERRAPGFVAHTFTCCVCPSVAARCHAGTFSLMQYLLRWVPPFKPWMLTLHPQTSSLAPGFLLWLAQQRFPRHWPVTGVAVELQVRFGLQAGAALCWLDCKPGGGREVDPVRRKSLLRLCLATEDRGPFS